MTISALAVGCAALAAPTTAVADGHRGRRSKRAKERKKAKRERNKQRRGRRGKRRGKGKGKGKGGGHNGGGNNGGGNNGGGNSGGQHPPTGDRWKLRGAGQLDHFSFGGSILGDSAGARGQFVVDIHPLAPAGTTLSLACRFTVFENFVIEGNVATFEAQGRCRRLGTDGEIEMIDVRNEFQIVDNEDGDLIDADFIGDSGIAIPGGLLDFGNLEVIPDYRPGS